MAKAKKEVKSLIKLQIPAGKANPAPPVGPALGQHGVNIKGFCEQFNAECEKNKTKPGTILPVIISVYKDKSFDFIIKTPPASSLLKELTGIKKGSSRPNTEKVGKVTKKQLEEIAKTKEPDLTAINMKAAMKTIAGTARSMGLNVEGGV